MMVVAMLRSRRSLSIAATKLRSIFSVSTGSRFR